MAQPGRSNVRYVDPQRRYTVVLGPSWNALSERCPTTTALEGTIVPMDDADRMPPLGAVKLRQRFFAVIHKAPRLVTGHPGRTANSEVPFWSALGARRSAGFWLG